MGTNGTSADDLLGTILSADNFFARLFLPAAPVERSEIRKAYRALALKCHPDKCEDERATDAFQRLSEAFETLYDEDLQRGHLESLADASRDSRKRARGARAGADPHDRGVSGAPSSASSAHRAHKRAGKQAPPGQHRPGRGQGGDRRQQRPQWWHRRSWTEVERELQRREVEEAELRANFVRTQSQGYSARQQRDKMVRAQNVLRELDARSGVAASRLWSREEDEVGEEAATPQDSPDSPPMFEEVLEALRDSHLYCFFCGAGFASKEEMDSYCPGLNEDDH